MVLKLGTKIFQTFLFLHIKKNIDRLQRNKHQWVASEQHELSGDREDTLTVCHYSLWKHTKVLPSLRTEYILKIIIDSFIVFVS